MFDELVRGMTSQEGELWDNAFVPSIRDHLFESSTDNGGLGRIRMPYITCVKLTHHAFTTPFSSRHSGVEHPARP